MFIDVDQVTSEKDVSFAVPAATIPLHLIFYSSHLPKYYISKTIYAIYNWSSRSG